MPETVSPIPEEFHAVTPHLALRDAARAIDFYRRALGAEELYRITAPDGKTIAHAELRIGDSIVWLGDEGPVLQSKSPQTLGGSSVTLHLYLPDVDAAITQAAAAGAQVTMPATDMWWGDRYGQVRDPFGHTWSIATRKRALSRQEIVEAGQQALAAAGPG